MEQEHKSLPTPHLPFYQNVEGVEIPGSFCADACRSGLAYQPRPGDLFIDSYPKCGTTWTQMIVFSILNKGKPVENVYEFYSKMPFLEMHGVETVEKEERPYAIKSHLPFHRVPYSDQAKYIYVTRNPKDAVISYFHHTATTCYLFVNGEFDVYFDLFMDGKVDFGDYFDHVLGWYEKRHSPNVLFLTFEELKHDTKGSILKIAKFIGEEHAKELEQDPTFMDSVLKCSSVGDMKKVFNDSINELLGDASLRIEDIDNLPMPSGLKHFRKFQVEHRSPSSKPIHLVRQGRVGGWREVLSAEQINRLDEKINSTFKETDLLALWKKLNAV